jgi:hypothetical protein
MLERARTRNYINAEYGVMSWLLTRDHKRIALLYLGSVTTFFALGGAVRGRHPARAAHARRRFRPVRDLQQAVHDARRDHGVLLPDPVDPGDAW